METQTLILPPITINTPVWLDKQPTGFIYKTLITNYRRTRHWKWGPMEARLTLTGPTSLLTSLFNTILGYDLTETGGAGFSGYISEMTLNYDGHSFVTSDEQLTNATRSKYNPLSLDDKRNLIRDSSFENTLSGWDLFTPGTSTITQVSSPIAADGTNSARLTTVGANVPILGQTIRVRELTNYKLTMQLRGDGTNELQYGLQNVTTAAYIEAIANTGVSAAAWTEFTKEIFVPAGCNQIQIVLLGPTSAGSGYVDQVDLYEYLVLERYTEYQTNETSIQKYGRREKTIDSGKHLEAEAIQEANGHLQNFSMPIVTAVKLRTSARDVEANPLTATLEIDVVNYTETAKWREQLSSLAVGVKKDSVTEMGNDNDVTKADSRRIETATIDELIKHAITVGCDYSTAGYIQPTTETATLPEGSAYEIFQAFVDSEDSTQKLYKIDVIGTSVNFTQHDRDYPEAYIDKSGAKASAGSNRRPEHIWNIKPGIWEIHSITALPNTTGQITTTETNQILIEAITTSADGKIKPQPISLDEYIDNPANQDFNTKSENYSTGTTTLT